MSTPPTTPTTCTPTATPSLSQPSLGRTKKKRKKEEEEQKKTFSFLNFKGDRQCISIVKPHRRSTMLYQPGRPEQVEEMIQVGQDIIRHFSLYFLCSFWQPANSQGTMGAGVVVVHAGSSNMSEARQTFMHDVDGLLVARDVPVAVWDSLQAPSGVIFRHSEADATVGDVVIHKLTQTAPHALVGEFFISTGIRQISQASHGLSPFEAAPWGVLRFQHKIPVAFAGLRNPKADVGVCPRWNSDHLQESFEPTALIEIYTSPVPYETIANRLLGLSQGNPYLVSLVAIQIWNKPVGFQAVAMQWNKNRTGVFEVAEAFDFGTEEAPTGFLDAAAAANAPFCIPNHRWIEPSDWPLHARRQDDMVIELNGRSLVQEFGCTVDRVPLALLLLASTDADDTLAISYNMRSLAMALNRLLKDFDYSPGTNDSPPDFSDEPDESLALSDHSSDVDDDGGGGGKGSNKKRRLNRGS